MALRKIESQANSSAEYRFEVDSVTEPEWSELMGHFSDANIYQTWAYGRVRWNRANLSHLILKRGHDALAMAQLRILRPLGLRVGIAYLRWGPMWHRWGKTLDAEVISSMAEALRNEYVTRRGLHLEILPNAFGGSTRAQMFHSAFQEFQSEGPLVAESYRTFVLDLSPSLEDLRRGLHPKWRNKLNGAERNGLKVVEADTENGYTAFQALYAEMLSRKKFNPGIDVSEFVEIQRQLRSKQRMILLLCVHGDEPVAGAVCSAMGDSAIYLIGASSERGRQLKGAYLLQWAMIKQLKDGGVCYYDLGGIDPEQNPGVHIFKSGLSGMDLRHIDPLCACANPFSAALVHAGKALHSDFFQPVKKVGRALNSLYRIGVPSANVAISF